MIDHHPFALFRADRASAVPVSLLPSVGGRPRPYDPSNPERATVLRTITDRLPFLAQRKSLALDRCMQYKASENPRFIAVHSAEREF